MTPLMNVATKLEEIRAGVSAPGYAPPGRIDRTLPGTDTPTLDAPDGSIQLRPGLYVCGDHRASASIQGAMISVRHAADALADELAEARAA